MGRLTATTFLLTAVAGSLFAAPSHVVEMFTSKFCPNCPSAEKKLAEVAAENPDLLVIYEHVDYWDRGEQKDPFGLKAATERQYDYSNTLSSRPGEVFTPMPIINGTWMASPPLWLSWASKLQDARVSGPLSSLKIERLGGGGLQVAVPKGIKLKNTTLYVLGVTKAENSVVRRLVDIQELEGGKSSITVPKALMPRGDEVVVLLQETGPKAVLAMAWLK